MGEDKAGLILRGEPLIRRVAAEVFAAAGETTIIGDPHRYQSAGYPVVADLEPSRGPAGGLFTALTITDADWNLVVACDMPEIRRGELSGLLRQALDSGGGCLAPREANGRVHPLCAVYHRNCLPAVAAALKQKILKMQEIILTLNPVFAAVTDPLPFQNMNTPEDWTRYTHGK